MSRSRTTIQQAAKLGCAPSPIGHRVYVAFVRFCAVRFCSSLPASHPRSLQGDSNMIINHPFSSKAGLCRQLHASQIQQINYEPETNTVAEPLINVQCRRINHSFLSSHRSGISVNGTYCCKQRRSSPDQSCTSSMTDFIVVLVCVDWASGCVGS